MALYNYVTRSGVIVPDTSDLQTAVEAEFKAALGDDLVTTPDTPEGLLIAGEVAARDAVVRNNAELANQINPNYAGGVFLDSLWALTGGRRTRTTSSTAVCTVTGTPGTIITTAVQFRSAAGDLWQVQSESTLDSNGIAQVEAAAVEPGPVSAASGTISSIVVGVLGLETVTNAHAARLGTLTQSDQAARQQRRRQLGLQGVALPTAIMAALYATDNVRSLTFRENLSDEVKEIDGVTMNPHSIYVCVDGGSDDDVAATLLSRKSLGANWNGDVGVSVTDPSSGQSYLVQFDRPDIIAILVRVTAKVVNPLINPQTAIREAIMAYANGELEGEDGFTVGTGVSPFELASAINRQEPGIFVQKLEVAFSPSGTFSTDTLPIAIFEKASVTEGAIQVVTT